MYHVAIRKLLEVGNIAISSLTSLCSMSPYLSMQSNSSNNEGAFSKDAKLSRIFLKAIPGSRIAHSRTD